MGRNRRLTHGKIPMKRREQLKALDEAGADRRIVALFRKHGAVAIDRSRLFSRSVIGSFNVPTLGGLFYKDYEFICQDCGAKQVWTGRQQKWWYEEAGGEMEALAIRCRACRRKEHERRVEAKRQYEEGKERKWKEREGRR